MQEVQINPNNLLLLKLKYKTKILYTESAEVEIK